MEFPEFDEHGDMPAGIYQATLEDALDHFGKEPPERGIVAGRLERILEIAKATGHLKRFIVFGSFVTAKPNPNDVDIFMIMGDDFDVTQVSDHTKLLFDHTTAQSYFGASVFWIRSMAALGGEDSAAADWMTTRRGTQRGIIEIIDAST